MKTLDKILATIQPIDGDRVSEGQLLCDQLAKPLGSLGKMESIYARLYAMFDGAINLSKKVVVVYAADNGVVDEGVSSNPQETTYIVANNMLQGKAGLCAISRHAGSEIRVIDMGCKRDLPGHAADKIRYGTGNILHEKAMSRQECVEAILVGYRRTLELIKQGYTLFGTGEMGVGNTTTSAAVISALLGLEAAAVTGYGAGLTDLMKVHKTEIIQAVVRKHAPYQDVLDLVSKVGGLDMLGIAGTYLACAQHQLPCAVDGLISITGLLIASRLCPHVLDFCFASHKSAEPGYQAVCESLGLEPLLLMDMRLGEGTGCPLAFFLLENSVYTIEHMPTFAEGNLSKADYIDIRPAAKENRKDIL